MPKKMADRTFKKVLAVSLCIVMALSGGMILWNGSVDENEDTTPAIVYLRSPRDVQLLDDMGVDIVEPYGGFVIAKLEESQKRLLEYRGLSVEAQEDLHTIALEGYTIDTRKGTPSIPADLYIEAYPNGGAGRYIVQFIGPVKEEWTRTVTNLGGQVGNYLPNNAFVVYMNDRTKSIVSELRFVQWVDIFQPAYKVRTKLWDMGDAIDVKIITYEGRSVNSVLARLTEDQVIRTYAGEDFGLVKATVDKSQLTTLANIPGVSFIEPISEVRATNMFMQWTVQTNVSNDRKMWDNGIDGTGQLVAIADSGVDFDHPAFRENQTTIVKGDIYNVTDMTRRKLVRYMPMASYVGIDPWLDDWAFQDSKQMPFAQTIGHGTMMSGIFVGNDDFMDISPNDGSSKGAKFIMQDVANVCDRGTGILDDCFSFIPDDYDDFFGPVYDEGARIHSNSWGTPEETYDLEARMVDKFVFEHTDMFITWSAGNGGPLSGDPHSVGSPANAKNLVSLGWVGSPSPLIPTDQNNVNGQGSYGRTPDGRMKPELLNLGEGTSTISDGWPWSDLYRPDDLIFGTSYGAPATAGMGAMIRQYYAEGYYPTGSPHPASATNVSAALIKALLMASGERCTAGFFDWQGEQQWPNNSQGWGRPLLDNVLYFPGDTKKTISVDHEAGLITGDVVEYDFSVMSNSVPLRVMLVWSDYPATLGAATGMVNDLDMVVTDPDGNQYKGNVFSAPFATSQSRTGGLADHENPTEGVHLWSPKAGVYNVKITAFNVPKGPQPFGLVINADIDTGFGQIQIDRAVYSENDVIKITVLDTNLVGGTDNVTYVTSTTEDVPEKVFIEEVGAGSGIWEGSIPTAFGVPFENNTLEVADKDIITVWYDDPDPVHTATAHAVVDAAGPIITDVFVKDITNAAATITWITDEPSDSRVFWGDTPALGTETYDPVMTTYHEVPLVSLSTGMMYYFDVQSADWMGHSTLDTNGGVHYTFTTTEKAEILLVIGDSTFPLENIPYWRNGFLFGGWSFNEYYVARTGDPPLSVLQQYKVVAWQTGFEQYPAFEDSQLPLLRNYVDGGGRLFVVSHDVAWASSPYSSSQFDTPQRYAFLRDILKADWLADPLDWEAIEGVLGDPIGGIYVPPNEIYYDEFRNGGAGDEVAAMAAGGTTNYVFKSQGVETNNDNCAIRWVSSANNDSVPGDDPNITWDGYPSKVVAFFFELTQMNPGVADDAIRGDVMNKTIIWLLDNSYHPVAEVSYPNGGEIFSGGTVDVYWNVTTPVGVANQSLFYSDDSGQTWKPIELSVLNTTRTYAWDISSLPNGDDYMVKIIVEDKSSPPLNGTDISDNTFSIFRPGGDLVGPVTVPGSVRVNPNPVIETGNVTFDATISDELKGDSSITAVEFFVQNTMPLPGDDGTGWGMNATDGTFDNVVENATWSTTPTPVKNFAWGTMGTHTVWVHGQDSAGNWGTYYNATFEIIATPPDRKVEAPSGITADLTGAGFADVTIAYTLSPDDPAVGTGENDVVRYDVYAGTSYDPLGAGYILIGNSPAGTNTYVDSIHGSGDPQNYFYYVMAVDDDANEKRTPGQAAKFTRYLTTGVHLVSNPLTLNDPNLLTVMQTLSFDTAWIYDPLINPTRPWITYDVNKAYHTPYSVDNLHGTWVNVLSDGYFTIAGRVPTSSFTISLRTGWNLVAYPSFDTTYTLGDLLADTNADRVETYDAAGAPYNLRHMTNPAETLVPGMGYWIQITTPVDWIVYQA